MIHRDSDQDQSLAEQLPDASWLLDGLLPLDEMQEKLGIRELPVSALGNYLTVGGFVIAMMARIPKRAEKFACADWEFEVVDMDRNRVDEVLATHLPTSKH
jgi:putative hemolysin